MSGFKRFLVPYDFSEHAEEALRAAGDLADERDDDLYLVHVVQPPAYGYGLVGALGSPAPAHDYETMEHIRKEALEALHGVSERLSSVPARVSTEVVDGSNIAQMVCETASRLDVDLIVMGTHGRTGLAHAFLGSVAERTLRNAPCPVLTVRSAAESDADR